MSERFEVAVVGSGFAGSILARALAAAGRRVVLLERGRHPRFALGESSTPLAAIALERLAQRYGLPDLRSLAAYGRWERELPDLRHGLKRGFTFLAHRPGRPLAPAAEGSGRLLVAASPSDAVADSHWLRADVDAFLVERAAAAGVDYRDGVELTAAAETADGMELRGFSGAGCAPAKPLEIRADFVVDASGGGRFLGRHLPIPAAPPDPNRKAARPATSLLYGHFEGWTPLAEAVGAAALGPPGPYPDERAAVHHLLEEGWAYVLPFDGYERGGRVSAGIELLGPAALPEGGAAEDPEAALRRIAGRYPTLAAQLAQARAVTPVRFVPRLQYRLARAAGGRWLLLPHAFAFTSPMFSTGIAWSLVAVERATRMLEAGVPDAPALARYGELLAAEADWIERLVAGAFRALPRFDLLAPWTLLYFAAASWAEAAQRLLDPPVGADGWCWDGFLGCEDPRLGSALAESERRLAGALVAATPAADAAFRDRVLAAIRERDLCGFDLPERRGLHPVDLETLVASAGRLGLTEPEIRAALPRLRGDAG